MMGPFREATTVGATVGSAKNAVEGISAQDSLGAVGGGSGKQYGHLWIGCAYLEYCAPFDQLCVARLPLTQCRR